MKKLILSKTIVLIGSCEHGEHADLVKWGAQVTESSAYPFLHFIQEEDVGTEEDGGAEEDVGAEENGGDFSQLLLATPKKRCGEVVTSAPFPTFPASPFSLH